MKNFLGKCLMKYLNETLAEKQEKISVKSDKGCIKEDKNIQKNI